MNTNTNNHKTSYSITCGLFFLIMCSVIFTVLYYSLPKQNHEPAISDYIDFSEGCTTSDGSPYVTVLIDDRQIYETMQPERVFFGKTPGASYVSLPIYRKDSGRFRTSCYCSNGIFCTAP